MYSPFYHSFHYFLFYLLTTFLICVLAPSIGFWASSLYILQTFISHCLLDVPWVPQTQYIIIELTSSSSIPKTSPLPYSQAWEMNYNIPNHLRQRPRYLWDSCFYLILLKIYYQSWWFCKPSHCSPSYRSHPRPSHSPPWLGSQQPLDWSSCLHCCPSILPNSLQPERS